MAPRLRSPRPAQVRRGQAPATTLVFNSRNKSYTEDGFGQEMAKMVADLHTASKLETDRCDLHELRHTFGLEAALAGCSDAQGGALMGHSSRTHLPLTDGMRLAWSFPTMAPHDRRTSGTAGWNARRTPRV
jgi:integrase